MQSIIATHTSNTSAALPANLIGRVRRFGPRGVTYEVIAVLSATDVKIRVIATGEEAAYPIADVLSDAED